MTRFTSIHLITGLLLPAVYFGILPAAQAQQPATDTLQVRLDEIRVEAARITETGKTAPFSVSIRNRSAYDAIVEPALTLDRIMFEVPGVWINNRENPALGERISIRGMGWRAAFGVRGIQMYMDGVPLTMPDGQTVTNVVDPAFISNMEIIRGPSSSMWGNASGGVIMLRSDRFTARPTVRVRGLTGSDGLYKTDAEASFRSGNVNYHFWGSHLQQDGFRDHSRFITTRLGANARWLISERSLLSITSTWMNSPTSFNPGSLTKEQASDVPRSANPFNVNQNAGKMNEQGQLGITYRFRSDDYEINTTGYGVFRDLENPLAFAWIKVDRVAYGFRSNVERTFEYLSVAGGIDMSRQIDDRKNWGNSGGERGDLRLDQKETVLNTALFTALRGSYENITLSTALRRDWIRFESDDFFQAGGDNSGSRLFQAWSPSAGISLDLGQTVLFLNAGTSYETPTTTELVNRPDMTGGFNQDIEPERTVNFETGVRGEFGGSLFRYELAVYSMSVRDRILPFRTEEGGDRDFFRNQGRSLHQGLEVFFGITPWRSAIISGSYSFSNNRFRSADEQIQGESLRDNSIPGLPDHRFSIRLEGILYGFRPSLQAERVSSYYVNSLNTVKNDAYTVADLRISHTGIGGKGFSVLPFLQISNIADVRYNSSVIINAANNRYFEPAAGRTFQAGFNVIWTGE
ncbi:MAG: TonB-dependent receptor [Balneolaceae bacterium]|nr:MAG: TonB-dependent receptor [Balneolaceae bacterium]